MTAEKKELLSNADTSLGRMNQEALDKHLLLSVELGDGLMEQYLAMGANPNVNDNQAMKQVVARGDLEGVKLLKKYGGDINVDIREPIKTGNLQMVEYFLKEGVGVDEEVETAESPYLVFGKVRRINWEGKHDDLEEEEKPDYLAIAIKSKNVDMVKLILEYSTCKWNHVSEAIYSSTEILELILQYKKHVKGWKLCEDDISSDILEYLLLRIREEPKIVCNSAYDIKRIIRSQLIVGISKADYNIVRLISKQEEFEEIRCTINNKGLDCKEEGKCLEIVENAKSAEEFNRVLCLLNEIGILNSVFSLKDMRIRSRIFRIATAETLKIYGTGKVDNSSFDEAIELENLEIAKELINMGMKPKREHAKKALSDVEKAVSNFYEVDERLTRLCYDEDIEVSEDVIKSCKMLVMIAEARS